MTPVMMAYWFAPVLAAWHCLGVGALFFSFVACWLNWRPFLAYGAGLLLVFAGYSRLVLGILLVLFPGPNPSLRRWSHVLMMVLMVAPTVLRQFLRQLPRHFRYLGNCLSR
jgi:hypothetical protein